MTNNCESTTTGFELMHKNCILRNSPTKMHELLHKAQRTIKIYMLFFPFSYADLSSCKLVIVILIHYNLYAFGVPISQWSQISINIPLILIPGCPSSPSYDKCLWGSVLIGHIQALIRSICEEFCS